MAVDKERRDQEATEASPLLRPGPSNQANGAHGVSGDNGTLANSSAPDSPDAAVVLGDEVTREGIPEMAKRLHILLPAIGIGIFLCALDQLLAVATVSSEPSQVPRLLSAVLLRRLFRRLLRVCGEFRVSGTFKIATETVPFSFILHFHNR